MCSDYKMIRRKMFTILFANRISDMMNLYHNIMVYTSSSDIIYGLHAYRLIYIFETITIWNLLINLDIQ